MKTYYSTKSSTKTHKKRWYGYSLKELKAWSFVNRRVMGMTTGHNKQGISEKDTKDPSKRKEECYDDNANQ